MPFQESAQSWRAKLHLGGARLPVAVGLLAVAALVAVLAGHALLGVVGADGFAVAHQDERANAKEGGSAASSADAGNAAGARGDSHDAADSDTQAGSKPNAGAEAPVVVHVGGAVAVPGVYELPGGSRVRDAIAAAGGLAADAAGDALNQARLVMDGERVIVPTEEEAAAQAAGVNGSVAGGGAAASASEAGGAGKVNINTAGEAELDTLPGVGQATAQKIIADREANGPFSSIEDLKRVSGIGDKKYAELADRICVG